ncbi:spore coat associated protein CotJA [Clostridium estertheticum]|uniref:Spore coat associated protein CotJA n=1 Tax=Clostridium estertheticum TaxID=238834 RepID=A0A7Y3SUH7_9CLOT|nr:spore coat associated protein CotJA [Clostridium estertheticum]NNU75325.1 spore coat associated protein CotJA [Clostridium estertheticum]WBL48206.1 spore coat associated protein CotJA [Clostridium estertheticum]
MEYQNRNKLPKSSASNNCVPQETIIKHVRLAAAYVPYQKLCTIFSPLEALKRGTAFPELYSPYDGEDKMSSNLKSSNKERTYGE